MTKNAIRTITDNEAQVTKAFQKNAMIFGTEEFKLWREYKAIFPNAKMSTKTIKKNPNKKTTKNLTYQNMATFIKEQKNAGTLLKELERQINLSKVQSNPYRAVLAWFEKQFKNYDSYKAHFAELAEEEAKKNNLFSISNSEEVGSEERTVELAPAANY